MIDEACSVRAPQHLVEGGERRRVRRRVLQLVLDEQQDDLAGVPGCVQPSRDLRQHLGEEWFGGATQVRFLWPEPVAHGDARGPEEVESADVVQVQLEAADVDVQLLGHRQLLVRVGVRDRERLAEAVERVVVTSLAVRQLGSAFNRAVTLSESLREARHLTRHTRAEGCDCTAHHRAS